jgi:hypothetical protein
MSIGNRIDEAFLKYARQDYDNAAIQTFILVDGTAKKKYKSNNNKDRFTALINDDLDLISKLVFFSYRVPNELILDNKTFADIIYQMRCSVLHEGFLDKVEWNERRLAYENETYIVPSGLLIALIILAVTSPENSSEKVNPGMIVELFYKQSGIRMRLAEYLGKRESLLALLENLK